MSDPNTGDPKWLAIVIICFFLFILIFFAIHKSSSVEKARILAQYEVDIRKLELEYSAKSKLVTEAP
jgi:hypothetical protein